MSLIALLPLLLTVLAAIAFAYYALARKSSAQAVCVREVVQMEHELGQLLGQLLRMNERAASLRAERLKADLALQSALASGYGPAIAAAKAAQLAVIVAQQEFHAAQLALLEQAETVRLSHVRGIQSGARRLGVPDVDSEPSFERALAVRPEPPLSLSPDYVPVEDFQQRQKHRFRFDVAFLPATFDHLQTFHQTTTCVASLQGEDFKWDTKILRARLSPNSL